MPCRRGVAFNVARKHYCQDIALTFAIREYRKDKDMQKGQSKSHSWMEAWVNIFIGYTINYTANLLIFPLFGMYISLVDNLFLGGIYTIISLVRQYVLRRYFNRMMVKLHIREAGNA